MHADFSKSCGWGCPVWTKDILVVKVGTQKCFHRALVLLGKITHKVGTIFHSSELEMSIPPISH